MIKQKDKNGLSDVVATVLIIAITVSAVVILAQVIIPFARSSLNKSTECTDYKTYYEFPPSSNYNCYNTNNTYFISVESSADQSLASDVAGLTLTFLNNQGNSNTIYIKNGTTIDNVTMLSTINGESPSTLIAPLPGETKTFVYQTSNTLQSVSMNVLLNSGSICQESATATFFPCQPAGGTI